MRVALSSRPLRVARRLGVAGIAAGLLAGPPTALGHGGATVAEGGRDGVTVLVQGAASQTESGGPAVDLSAILGGPGSGDGARVDLWIRTADGRKPFRVRTTRDDGGTFHADVSTADRPSWDDWAIAAIVTLSDDRRLRVANISGDEIPGPSPSQTTEQKQEPADQSDAPTTPTLSEGPSTPDAAGDGEANGDDAGAADASTDGDAIEDISGERDGPPAWAFPSLLALTIVGLAILAVKRRRPTRD